MNSGINRKLAAIMFADIVGYSRMMGSNEEETLKLLSDFESLSSSIVKKFKGSLIKKNGDEIFCQFDSAKNAVDACIEIQNNLSKYNHSRPKDFKLEVRIGIHIGDVVKREDGDIHGDGVNVAARIQPLASPGGICVSGAVTDALSSHPGYDIVSKGDQELKHIVKQHSIFDLKTGHERSINRPKKTISFLNTAVKNPIYLSISLIFVFIISYLSYSKINTSNSLKNIYFDITSSKNYVDNYYKDYGYGSYHYFDKEKYIISSITDSLRNKILESAYQRLTSIYTIHGITIESSFKADEADLINDMTFLKDYGENYGLEESKIIMTKLSEMVEDRNEAYKNKFPDILARYFIYKADEINGNDNYFFFDKSFGWGKGLNTGYTAMMWEANQSKYSYDKSGIDSLILGIVNNAQKTLNSMLFNDNKVSSHIGKVIEILDDDVIKFKQNEAGLVRKNMKLWVDREYHWANGGAELYIEDLDITINYLTNTDPYQLWLSSKKNTLEKYNEIEFNQQILKEIELLNIQKNKVEEKLFNNLYNEHTKSSNSTRSYTMEVVDIIGQLVIAKVVGTQNPKESFKYRIDDRVFISE